MNTTMNDQTIKDILIKQNEDFKSLALKHREFELRLKELNNSRLNTDRDWLEVRNIKKHKLQVKDSMQRYIFEYRKKRSQC
jgi:uncharacterized protein YdcH (DUF465 family)